MGKFDEAKFALEAATGGKNTLILDDLGYPSVMVCIPQFKWSEVIEGGEDEVCSAFIVDGKVLDRIYISKYLNVIENGRAYSLPAKDPANTINIDEARAACANKGRGWHLMTNAEWCAISHWCIKNNSVPRGNTNFGRDAVATHEHGVPARTGFHIDDTVIERTLTGTGPDSWSHDGTSSGIFDLSGNIWDFIAGFRVVDGEIQIINDNDSALNVDESSDSKLWKAINKDGELVEPGSPDTYKYDAGSPGNDALEAAVIPDGVKLSFEVKNPQYTGDKSLTNHEGAFSIMPFKAIVNDTENEPPLILKKLGFFSTDVTDPNDLFFIRSYGERLPARGGSWFDNIHAGLWDLYLRDDRLYEYPDIGFRAAYIEI